MKFSFRRITTSGNFIPEIDGLRFIAVASVVLFHIHSFLVVHPVDIREVSSPFVWVGRLLYHGAIGVPLFFVISGFILGLPFANTYLNNGKAVDIGKYFARRLTRLEPPYILVMSILFFGALGFARNRPAHERILDYLSSLVYCHNFIFGRWINPTLNSPAWTLEIEIQFYLIAPVLARLFLIRSSIVRRSVIAGIAFIFVAIGNYNTLSFVSLIDWLQYFLVGFVLVDLYVARARMFDKTKYDNLIAFAFFAAIWAFDPNRIESHFQAFAVEIVDIACIYMFYYYVFFHHAFKWLSFRWITNLGGMCYSIYLLHSPIIAVFGTWALRHWSSGNFVVNGLVYSVIFLALIICLSSVFFLLIERPCMDKDWVRKLFARRDPIS